MRLDIDKQRELEPKRFEYAIVEIQKLGYEVSYHNPTWIKFEYKGSLVTLYPYSGWFTGKTVKDGRGIDKLLKKIQ